VRLDDAEGQVLDGYLLAKSWFSFFTYTIKIRAFGMGKIGKILCIYVKN